MSPVSVHKEFMWSHCEGNNESIPSGNGHGQGLGDHRAAGSRRQRDLGLGHQGSP